MRTSRTRSSGISDLFPGSAHVKAAGLSEADDGAVWEWTKQYGFAIVSKETDFHRSRLTNHMDGRCPRYSPVG